MKLNKPVEIEMETFIQKGEFDCIKIGQTKEWILNNFPDPDSISNIGHNLYIWLYGNIEFHFDGELLSMIYSDYLETLNAGDNIILDKWILNHYENLNLLEVIKKLNQSKIDFTLTHDITSRIVSISILESEVNLLFNSEEANDINLYQLGAFSLKNKKHFD
ncbi:hypothetical protein FFC86_01040 [Listeria monocytogenes]|nr:hypothetical protein [Listeria monocytogenes]